MYSLLFLALCSFALALVLTPVCRDLFTRWGILDAPIEPRKLHTRPTPRVGGIPIVLAWLGSYALLMLSPFNGGAYILEHFSQAARMLPAVALIFATGLLDDIVGLKAWQKLIGQCGAAALAFWAGASNFSIIGHAVPIWVALPLTMLWLLACTNAFNLIDGVDGLAAGIGLCSTLTLIAAGLLQSNVVMLMAMVPLAGALLAFLRYNFNPATIFLGDSGSMLIGFLLGCYSILWSQKTATLLGMSAPLIALGTPLLDIGVSIIRRFLRNQPIFAADRGHIHHRLLDRGFTPRRVVLLLYGVSAVFAVLSVLSSVLHEQYVGLILILFGVVAVIGIRSLNYTEFDVARRMLQSGAFRGMLNAQITLQGIETSLRDANAVEELWTIICRGAKDLGFSSIQLELQGKQYQEIFVDSGAGDCWQCRLSLSQSDHISLAREFACKRSSAAVVPFVDMLRASLGPKITALEESQRLVEHY